MFKGSLVALVTPFTSQEEIDYEALSSLIEWHINQGTDGIVIAGTTGESATLSFDEKVALATFSAQSAAGRINIIVGNGDNCTRSAIALTKALNDTGVDGFLTVTPSYIKPTESGLLAHFSEIAKVSQLPIILYNVPSRTACDMSVELVAKLAELNNIVALKDATGELSRLPLYKQSCPSEFTLLSGDDETGTEFCKQGGDGVISVTANVMPKAMAKIQRLIEEKKYQQAYAIDEQLAQLHKNLFVESNPIPVKWGLFKIKQLPNAHMRLPLTELSERGQQILGRTLDDLTTNLQEF